MVIVFYLRLAWGGGTRLIDDGLCSCAKLTGLFFGGEFGVLIYEGMEVRWRLQFEVR